MELSKRTWLIIMLAFMALILFGGARLIEFSEQEAKVEREKYIHTFDHPMYDEQEDGTIVVFIPVGDVLVTYCFFADGDKNADVLEVMTPEYVRTEHLDNGTSLSDLFTRLSLVD